MDPSLLDNILPVLRSEKAAPKLKAFKELTEMLNSRLTEVQKLVNDSEDGFSWERIFKAAHDGTVSHVRKLETSSTELLETDPKIATYSRALIKICDSPQNGEKFAQLFASQI